MSNCAHFLHKIPQPFCVSDEIAEKEYRDLKFIDNCYIPTNWKHRKCNIKKPGTGFIQIASCDKIFSCVQS